MKSARLALVLAVSLCLAGVPACGSSSGDAGSDSDTEQEEEVVLTEDDVEETGIDEDELDGLVTDLEESQESGEANVVEGKRVGADGIGYVTVPTTWVEFSDVDGNTSIQYCDGTPYTIISLNVFDLSTLDESQRESFTVEDAANSVYANMLSDGNGLTEDSIEGARVQLAGRDALQLYALYPDGSYLVCWTLEDDAGTFHYVAAEGTEDTIMECVNYVETSYSFDE